MHELGGFDESFFMYMEEVDLCVRLAQRGLVTHWVPGAEVIHRGQLSTGADSPERAIEMARSRRLYWERHYGRAGRTFAKLAVSLQFAGLAAAASLRGAVSRPFRLQAQGCWRDSRRPGLRERALEFNERRRCAPSSA
jgi:hypothetical protein